MYSVVSKYGGVAMSMLGVGVILGMLIHAFTFQQTPKISPKETKSDQLSIAQSTSDKPSSLGADLSSSKQLVQALFPGARTGGGKKNIPLDPAAEQVRGILRNPVSSYQKVATLMNLAKTLPLNQRRLAYAGAAFACEAQEFQQLMLPIVWDAATPADLAQVLAGGVVGLPDAVRLPICLTYLKHRDESVRMTGQAVLAAYFPEADESAYPAAVQAYLAHPD